MAVAFVRCLVDHKEGCNIWENQANSSNHALSVFVFKLKKKEKKGGGGGGGGGRGEWGGGGGFQRSEFRHKHTERQIRS